MNSRSPGACQRGIRALRVGSQTDQKVTFGWVEFWGSQRDSAVSWP